VTARGDRPGSTPVSVDLDDAFLHRLERLALRARRVPGGTGTRPGRRRTPAADFVDHRPYTPGDDQRHIDWPAVARTDEVFVKVGRAPQAAHVHLVLDTTPSMQLWPEKRRLSRQLTAALGWLALVRGDRLNLVVVPPTAGADWGPASGGGHCREFLAHLGGLPCPAVDRSDLTPATRGLARRSAAGGLVVVVSDLWVSDDLDRALGVLPAPLWDVVVAQVLDATELEPRADGAVELCDAETGESLPTVLDAAVRLAYRRALTERLDRLQALTAARGGQHLLLPAHWPFERAVIPLLQRHAVLGP
jgi:uncharacterized protein (DUF58 family)